MGNRIGYLPNQIRSEKNRQKLRINFDRIKYTFSQKMLNNFFEDVLNNKITLTELADNYGFDIEALSILYVNYKNELMSKEEKATSKKQTVVSPKEDQIYNTGSLIKNIKVYKSTDKKKKIKVYYNDPNLNKVVDGTKENVQQYTNMAMNDGETLFNTIDKKVKEVGSIKKTQMSDNEKLLYSKWKVYLKMANENTGVMEALDVFDLDSTEIILKRLISYQKLNSLEYSLKNLKSDAEFVSNCYQYRIKK